MDHSTLYISAAIFAGIYMLSMLVFFMFRQYMRLKEKQLVSEHARMDDFRAHLERQIVELNQRFGMSEDRWREVNHLVVAGQSVGEITRSASSLPQKSQFLSSHGIDPSSVHLKDKLIFVLTPFHDDFDDEFQTVARVGRDFGFDVVRGDERVHSGEIFSHLLRLLVEARLVIANISGRNPNVFYELGIAHALDKPVILIAHKKAEVPFDIRSKRIIFYDDNQGLQRDLERMLARTLVGRNA